MRNVRNNGIYVDSLDVVYYSFRCVQTRAFCAAVCVGQHRGICRNLSAGLSSVRCSSTLRSAERCFQLNLMQVHAQQGLGGGGMGGGGRSEHSRLEHNNMYILSSLYVFRATRLLLRDGAPALEAQLRILETFSGKYTAKIQPQQHCRGRMVAENFHCKCPVRSPVASHASKIGSQLTWVRHATSVHNRRKL